MRRALRSWYFRLSTPAAIGASLGISVAVELVLTFALWAAGVDDAGVWLSALPPVALLQVGADLDARRRFRALAEAPSPVA